MNRSRGIQHTTVLPGDPPGLFDMGLLFHTTFPQNALMQIHYQCWIISSPSHHGNNIKTVEHQVFVQLLSSSMGDGSSKEALSITDLYSMEKGMGQIAKKEKSKLECHEWRESERMG